MLMVMKLLLPSVKVSWAAGELGAWSHDFLENL